MTENPKIYVWTRAYNAEKTIRRTVDSVLDQTYADIVYVLIENGSTDGTYAICKEYAEKDNRVILFHNAKNDFIEPTDEARENGLRVRDIMFGEHVSGNDFFCILDADDEYMPDFFERGVNFAAEHDLDIVIGGTEFIDTQTGQNAGYRTHGSNWIIEGAGFADSLAKYHWHMRQVWGKLCRRKVEAGRTESIQSFVEKELGDRQSYALPYGIDTIYVMYLFAKAKKVGVLSGCQHKYYMSSKSLSYKWVNNRDICDRVMDKYARDYLIGKCGEVSLRNDELLQAVYFNNVRDTLNVLLNAAQPISEKYAYLRDIITCEPTGRMIEWQGYGAEKAQLFGVVAAWLLARQKERRSREGADAAAEVLLAVYPDLRLLTAADALRFVIMKIPNMAESLIGKDYARALERLMAWIRNHDIDDAVAETFLMLGENLSAAAENADCWLFFKKHRARFLLDSGRAADARALLEELTELLPDDAEAAELLASTV